MNDIVPVAPPPCGFCGNDNPDEVRTVTDWHGDRKRRCINDFECAKRHLNARGQGPPP